MTLLNLSNDIWNEIVLHLDMSEWQHIENIENFKSIKIWELTKKRKISLLKAQGYKYITDEEMEELRMSHRRSKEVRYAYEPPEELCEFIIRCNWSAIKHMQNPNEKICNFAVRRCCSAIQYIKNEAQTKEVQQIAVQRNGHMLEYILNPSEEIKRLAVQQNGFAIKYIDDPSEELYRLAVQTHGRAMKYIDVKAQTEELCRLAVQQNSLAIEFVSPEMNNYKELCRLAVQQNGRAINFVSPEIKNYKELCGLAQQYV